MVQIYLLDSREKLHSLNTSWETIIPKILGKDEVGIEFPYQKRFRIKGCSVLFTKDFPFAKLYNA